MSFELNFMPAGEQQNTFKNASYSAVNGLSVSIAVKPLPQIMWSRSELAEIHEEHLEPLTEKGFNVSIVIGTTTG